MKNKSIILILLLMLSFVGNAQYEEWGTGKIYLKDGTTLEGLVRFYYFVDGPLFSNEKMRYKTERNKPSKKIAAKNVDSINFDLPYTGRIKGKNVKRTRKVTFLSIAKNKKKTKFGYAELVIDGKVKLLKRSYVDGRTTMAKRQTLFLKEGGMVNTFDNLKSFKKSAQEYFGDCPALCAKIEKNVFRRKDAEKIAEFYNSSCN
ncbi:hypothetical protein [Winogradskyella forsetii]|uniref:hypothetical protein n=1 Tax=Winogradskyella forsetii TaxID=2686077 RepID=UPI0015BC75BA|nr:hypothetical protein [Winogradskyella forsetii]